MEIFYHFINFSMIFADERANGIPPPGCTLPPQKNIGFILRRSFFVTENAANRLLLEVPYKEPL
jgi:hypothetical protein